MTKYFTKDGDDYKEVEDTLFTQSEIDTNIIPKRLERERGKYADYDTLKEKAQKVDTIESEWKDKLAEKDVQIGELTTKVKTAELGTEKVKIISKYKLSDEAAEFLTGDTVEDLEAKAEKLSKIAPGGKVTISKSGKPKEGEDKNSSSAIARNLFRRNNSDA
jgi:hypothetical protein